jgi:hypothetical protein
MKKKKMDPAKCGCQSDVTRHLQGNVEDDKLYTGISFFFS